MTALLLYISLLKTAYTEIAVKLIQAVANVNDKDNDGYNALDFACYKDNSDMAHILLSNGVTTLETSLCKEYGSEDILELLHNVS